MTLKAMDPTDRYLAVTFEIAALDAHKLDVLATRGVRGHLAIIEELAHVGPILILLLLHLVPSLTHYWGGGVTAFTRCGRQSEHSIA